MAASAGLGLLGHTVVAVDGGDYVSTPVKVTAVPGNRIAVTPRLVSAGSVVDSARPDGRDSVSPTCISEPLVIGDNGFQVVAEVEG